MRRTVFVFSSKEDVPVLLREMKKVKNPEILCIDYNAYVALERRGFKPKFYDFHYKIPKRVLRNVEKRTGALLKEWYMCDKPFESLRSIADLPYGSLFYDELLKFFINIIKRIEILSYILRDKNVVYVDGDSEYHRIVKDVAPNGKGIRPDREPESGTNRKIFRGLETWLWNLVERILSSARRYDKVFLTYNTILMQGILERMGLENALIVTPNPKTAVYMSLRSKKCGFLSLWSFRDRGIRKFRRAVRDAIKNDWRVIDEGRRRDGLIYTRIDLWDLVKKRIRELFFSRIEDALITYNLIEKLHKRTGIDFILLTSLADTTEKVLAAASRNLGIPSMVVQHGLIPERHIPGYGYIPTETDKIAVWGRIPFRTLTDLGVPESKVVITGSPKFDGILKKKSSKEEVYGRCGFELKKKIVFFAAQPYGGRLFFESPLHREIILREVLKAGKEIKDVQIVVKTHPVEDKGYYESMGSERYREIINGMDSDALLIKHSKILERTDTQKMMAASDVIITFGSLCGLEGLALGKPLIIMNLTGYPDYVPFVREGAALGVYERDKLKSVLEKVLKGKYPEEGMRRFVDGYLHKLDGRSLERLSKVVEGMLNENKPGIQRADGHR